MVGLVRFKLYDGAGGSKPQNDSDKHVLVGHNVLDLPDRAQPARCVPAGGHV